MRRMYIHTPAWHTFYYITFISVSVTLYPRRRSGRRWLSRRKCLQFSWRCTDSFASPACLRILCCAILAWKTAIHVIFINHCWGSFYRSLHFPCPGNSTPCFFSSRTSAQGCIFGCCILSIVASENRPLAILAIFKARHMSGCSSCTRPPRLAIVVDMLKTYKKLVSASKRKIRRLPQPYMTP